MMRICRSPSGIMPSSYYNVCSDVPTALDIFFSLPFSIIINRKIFSLLKLQLSFLMSGKLFLLPSSDVSLLYVIVVKPSEFLK